MYEKSSFMLPVPRSRIGYGTNEFRNTYFKACDKMRRAQGSNECHPKGFPESHC